MADLELTKLAAEAMGLDQYAWQTAGIVTGSDLPILMPEGRIMYDPLHDDAQAMALVKRFTLEIRRGTETLWWVMGGHQSEDSDDLNRAICLCVAKEWLLTSTKS